MKIMKKLTNLYNMIVEADILLFLFPPVFNIEDADKISSPATKKSIEDLQYNA